jgi:hypothetical protein
MDSQGNLRELKLGEKLKELEIAVPEAKLEEVQAMNRQQRRAFYRAEKKKGLKK